MALLHVPAPHGRLEALWWPHESPVGAAVVCHPHPLAGGNLHSTLNYRLAAALRSAGFSVLRFNFRGVGASTGAYDDGPGELDDARAALDWLRAEAPGVPLWSTGFSFGARTALQLGAAVPEVRAVLAVGLALRLFDLEFATALAVPVAVVQSEHDEFADVREVRALVAMMPRGRLFELAGADHLATGRHVDFDAAVSAAVAWLRAGAAP